MRLVKTKITPSWTQTEEEAKKIENVKEVTLTDVTTRESYSSKNDKIRINILGNIKNIYAKVNPYIFYESIIVAIIFVTISTIKKRYNIEEIIILLGLVGIYLSRIFIISFTSVTMYTSAINVLYLAPTYVIQMIFSLLSNVFLIKEIVRIKNERKK